MLPSDLAYAGRTLRKSPGFTATAVATIALGIGASTAIFSVTSAVLLRPLPYRNPDRLVLACLDLKKRNVSDFPLSNADFTDLGANTKTTFEEFAALHTSRAIFPREDGSPEQVPTAAVTTNFFRFLGAKIAFGRDFVDADGTPGAPSAQPSPTIVILSYEYWQRRYGGNTAILGHGMRDGGRGGPQIVGVLAPRFELLFPPKLSVERAPAVWTAARLNYDSANRTNVSLRVIGRLKPGVRLEQAQAEAELVAVNLRKIVLIWRTAGFYIRLEPMQQYLAAEVRPAILALMGAAIFLLLIACANVANLLLVRASLRERELAVRTALGGSRWRLLRQMLAEAVLLAGAGAILGVGLALLGIRQLLVIAPANLPRLESIAIDARVLAFAALAALTATVVFGVAPALRASRPDVMQILRASGRTGALASGGLPRNTVVILEVALSFVLLIGSGLMFRSFLALQRIDPGFDPHGVLTFLLVGGRAGSTPPQRAALMRERQNRLQSLPGVRGVTASSQLPLAGGPGVIRWGTAPALTDPSQFQAADFQGVLPGYFETLRTPLLAGRTFNDADDAPERNGVMIDQFLAAKAFPGESAVGKRILVRVRTATEPEWVEIIGVVTHQRQGSLAEAGREQIYFTDGFLEHGAAAQGPFERRGDPAKYAAVIRAEMAKLDSEHHPHGNPVHGRVDATGAGGDTLLVPAHLSVFPA